jgi:hypothetical protein
VTEPRKRPVSIKAGEVWTGAGAYACLCGAREEVQTPAPRFLECFLCKRLTMEPYPSRYPVPPGAARPLTDAERSRMLLAGGGGSPVPSVVEPGPSIAPEGSGSNEQLGERVGQLF